MNAQNQPFLVSVNEAARMLGLSKTSVYEKINAGQIKAKKDGYRTLIQVAELLRYAGELPDFEPGSAVT